MTHVYVLHAFDEKAPATSKRDIGIAKARCISNSTRPEAICNRPALPIHPALASRDPLPRAPMEKRFQEKRFQTPRSLKKMGDRRKHPVASEIKDHPCTPTGR